MYLRRQSVPGDDDGAQVDGAGACMGAGTNMANLRSQARRQWWLLGTKTCCHPSALASL